MLLRPLPYRPGSEVVVLGEDKPCCLFAPTAPGNLLDYQRYSHSFEQLGATMGNAFVLNRQGADPLFLLGVEVTSNYFDVFGVPALLGRTLEPAIDRPGGPCAAVLSHGAWRRAFGADPRAIGKAVQINDHPCALAGVMPEGFSFLNRADLWVGSSYAVPTPGGDPTGKTLARRDLNYLRPIGRLRTGVTLSQARYELVTISHRLALAFPEHNAKKVARLRPLRDWVVRDAGPALWMLLAAVGLILLIACSNLANLLLARGAVREREMALRASLGAGRLRLIRQLMTETVLLGALGGGLGLLLAAWGVRLLKALGSADLPRIAEVRIDSGVLAFTLAASLLAGMLSGLAPVLRSIRLDAGSVLKQTGRGIAGGGERLRRGLVVAEIAMSLALLIGAGLLIRSFARMLATSPGFEREGVIAADLRLPATRYPSQPPVIAFTDQLLRRVKALPGVVAAGIVDAVPFGNGDVNGDVAIAGRPQPRPGEEITAEKKIVSGDYFRAMRIPVLRGRAFDDRDASNSTPVVIVNQNLARLAWPDLDPLGKRLSWDGGTTWLTVVGVVGNVHLYALDEKPMLDTYRPYRQQAVDAFTLVARRDAHPLGLAMQLRREVLALDRRQPIGDIDLLANMVDQSLSQRRFQMLIITSLALLALALASVGVYGIMSYAVQQRAQEIGVRVALGARRGQVFALVLRSTLAMSALGIAAGVLGSLLLGRWVQALLFGIRSHDPAVYVLACGTLFGISLVAAYLPARRAAAIDPAVTLRGE